VVRSSADSRLERQAPQGPQGWCLAAQVKKFLSNALAHATLAEVCVEAETEHGIVTLKPTEQQQQQQQQQQHYLMSLTTVCGRLMSTRQLLLECRVRHWSKHPPNQDEIHTKPTEEAARAWAEACRMPSKHEE
jgi:hypothetical protein